jgi:hypothetical protein
MSDNVQLPVTGDGTADVVQATDEVGGVHFPRVKLDLGADGASTPVAGSLPVNDAGGSLTVDGPLTDTQLRADPVEVDGSGVTQPVSDAGGSLTVDGAVNVGGPAAQGAAIAGNPVLVAGKNMDDGTVDTVLTDGLGQLKVNPDITYDAVVGVATPGWVAMMGGIGDDDNAHELATDNAGQIKVASVGGTVAVSDGGASLTVDGTVSISSSVVVTDGAGSLTVDNTVLSVVGGGTEAAAQRVTIATDSTGVLSVDDNGGNLSIDDGGNSITVDQPTGSNLHMVVDSGTVTTVSTVTAVTTVTNVVHVDDNAGNLSIDDGGNSITVDAPVAAPVFVRLSDGATAIATLPVSLATAPTTTVAQGTAANLNMTEASASAIKTSVELIDDTVYTDDTSTHATGTSKGLLLMAAATPTDASVNANDIGAVAMTTDRKLHVAVQDALPAGSANIGDVDVLTVPAPLSTAGNGTAATAHRVTIASDTTGVLAITDNAGSLTVDQPTGTNLHTVVDSGTITTVSTVSTVTNVVHVDDNSGSLTVDAPVGTPLFARLSDGSAALGTGNGTAASALRVTMASDSTGTVIATQSTASNLKAQVTYAYPLVYAYNIASTVHVASANTVMWDMFNADAALVVRVLSIRQIPNVTTAVTGVVFDWLLERTTAVGTGGTGQTAWLADLNDTALDADITCRLKPSGGATQSTDLFNYSLSSEETSAATIQIASQGGLELVPLPLQPMAVQAGKGIVLRQNQGIRCVQITNSNAGNTGWLIVFSVE